MHSILRHLLPALAALAPMPAAFAQTPTPVDGPPWWGVSDDRTLSLYFDFNSLPLTPQVIGQAPSWYAAQNTFATLTGPLQILPSLAGHNGVLGLQAGAPQAQLLLTVDNDPHLNWVKVFFFQFDVFEGSAGSIVSTLSKDLQKYERSSMTWNSTPIGNGWETVTINVELWPQPDDEQIEWSFLSDPNSDTGIDNLFIDSKCVKIGDADAGGKALGEVDQSAFPGAGLDLLAATGADCRAVAVTEDPQTLQRTYWISAVATAAQNHRIFRLDATGSVLGVTPLPFSATTSPFGATDLAVRLQRPNPLAPYAPVALYGLVQTAAGGFRLVALDIATGATVPTQDIVIQGLNLPPDEYGLAFNPSGDFGQGIFVITDPAGVAWSVSAATGQVVDQFPIPPGTRGAGYDHVFGNYSFWSSQANGTPLGTLRTNGFEISAYDHRPTGAVFQGNLVVPNPGGVPAGVAAGLEVYRRLNGELKIACVARTLQSSFLYELEGPFRYGQSLVGRTAMNGQPFAGSTNFSILLEGIEPRGLFATLYVGFSNQASGAFQLPFALSPFGFDESQVLVSLDMSSALLAQSPTGEFRFPLPVLSAGFRGVPMFFQWLLFDPQLQNGMGMSPAGKTIVY